MEDSVSRQLKCEKKADRVGTIVRRRKNGGNELVYFLKPNSGPEETLSQVDTRPGCPPDPGPAKLQRKRFALNLTQAGNPRLKSEENYTKPKMKCLSSLANITGAINNGQKSHRWVGSHHEALAHRMVNIKNNKRRNLRWLVLDKKALAGCIHKDQISNSKSQRWLGLLRALALESKESLETNCSTDGSKLVEGTTAQWSW